MNSLSTNRVEVPSTINRDMSFVLMTGHNQEYRPSSSKTRLVIDTEFGIISTKKSEVIDWETYAEQTY